MQINEQLHGAVIVLRPTGPLIGEASDAFRACVSDAARRSLGRVTVDASDVTYVDSLGIEAMVDVTEQLANSGRALKLCMANDTVRLALELTGWTDSFEFFDDVGESVRSFL